MSGDCGHGWGYHSRGASGPCDKCTAEQAKKNGLARELFEKYADQLVREAGTDAQYKQDEVQFKETVVYLLEKHGFQ